MYLLLQMGFLESCPFLAGKGKLSHTLRPGTQFIARLTFFEISLRRETTVLCVGRQPSQQTFLVLERLTLSCQSPQSDSSVRGSFPSCISLIPPLSPASMRSKKQQK